MSLDLRLIVRALGGELSGGQALVPGPGHSKRDRSLSIRLSATSPEGFIVHSFAGDDWRTCHDHVRDGLGLPRDGWKRERPQTPAPRPLRKDAGADDKKHRHLLLASAAWNEAEPIAGTDGEDYLRGRGIMLDDVPDHGGLRWHPRCPWETGTKPCIVSRFTDAITAEPRGIHRRPITGEKPKSLGQTVGCVIRLWADDCVERGIVLGEGVETVLAAATRITHQGTYLRPAWAAGYSENMASFPPLNGVESLTLLVDHDPKGGGQRAAEQCARRWRDARKEVIRLMPGNLGDDFNDLVKP